MAVSPALSPPPGNPRFPLMDSLRGVTALMVVFAHAYNALHRYGTLGDHGFLDDLHATLLVAVPVFFALSGFLLFRPWVAAFAHGARGPRTSSFFRRRVLRVVPAYWVALTVTAIVWAPAAVHTFSDHWWVFYLFGQAYSLTDNYHGLAVAWTLSVDATFYAILPLIAAVAFRLAGRWGWRAATLAVTVPLLVIGPVVRLLNSVELEPGAVTFVQKIVYGLPGEVNFFAVGMALAIASVHAEVTGAPPRGLRWLAARPVTSWALAGVVYVVISAFFSFAQPEGGLGFRARFLGSDLLSMAFVVFAFLPTTFDVRPNAVRSILAWRPLAFVGLVSYGVYLWHVPIEEWLLAHGLGDIQTEWALGARVPITFAIVLALSVAAGAVSYYVVELPFLRLKERRPGRGRPVKPAEVPSRP